MRISQNRLFPYPVLYNDKDSSSYKNSIYRLEYDNVVVNNNYLIINQARIELNNDEFKNLIDEGKVQAYLLIECPGTIYREKFKITYNKGEDIQLDIRLLEGKVEVTSFMAARCDFKLNNIDFLDDYSGYEFNVEKGSILAIEDGFDTNVDYSTINDKKVSSIFLIIRDREETKNMKVIADDRKKIKIYMPPKEYDKYYSLKSNEYFQNIFFSIIAIPALTKAIQYVQDRINLEELQLDEYMEDFKWLRSIIDAYKKIKQINIDTDEFKELDAVEISQIVMNNASVNAIDDLITIFAPSTNREEDEDE